MKYKLIFILEKPQLALSLGLGSTAGGPAGAGGPVGAGGAAGAAGGVSRRRPGLSFIPQLNLANSVQVDIDLPLERQE